MKTIIEDVVVAMDGGQETELPLNTSIRFENGKDHYCVQLKEDGLHIHKVNGGIFVEPKANNTVVIK